MYYPMRTAVNLIPVPTFGAVPVNVTVAFKYMVVAAVLKYKHVNVIGTK